MIKFLANATTMSAVLIRILKMWVIDVSRNGGCDSSLLLFGLKNTLFFERVYQLYRVFGMIMKYLYSF